ncbi:MAG: (2Fe-2S) ferredoxin domain-containing protein [Planctomycetes bacterium]|nr:(2Fe-2S) ferredoxin domain-containing protein [Planctomycetota bacterium]
MDVLKIRPYRRHLLLCTGPRCTQGESAALWASLGERFRAAGIDEDDRLRVKRTQCSCFAVCRGGPIVCVQPDGIWYHSVTSEVMDRIVREHLKEGRVVEEYVFHRGPLVAVQA